MPVLEYEAFRWLGVLKTAIANQLCVQSTIDAVVNLLKKDPVHSRVKLRARFRRFNRDYRSSRPNALGCEACCCKNEYVEQLAMNRAFRPNQGALGPGAPIGVHTALLRTLDSPPVGGA